MRKRSFTSSTRFLFNSRSSKQGSSRIPQHTDMGMEISKAEQVEVDVLVEAASNGDYDTVAKRLLDMNGKDAAGDTALHVSALRGHLNIVQLLVDQGGALEIDPKDHNNTTPLMHACNNGYYEIVLMLVKAGAKVTAMDNMGWTPLHYACSRGHVDCVRLLIEKHGADPFAIDYEGSTPLHIAIHGLETMVEEEKEDAEDPYDFVETVRILLFEAGSCPLLKNHEGKTPAESLECFENLSVKPAIRGHLERAEALWKDHVAEKGDTFQPDIRPPPMSELPRHPNPVSNLISKMKNAVFGASELEHEGITDDDDDDDDDDGEEEGDDVNKDDPPHAEMVGEEQDAVVYDHKLMRALHSDVLQRLRSADHVTSAA